MLLTGHNRELNKGRDRNSINFNNLNTFLYVYAPTTVNILTRKRTRKVTNWIIWNKRTFDRRPSRVASNDTIKAPVVTQSNEAVGTGSLGETRFSLHPTDFCYSDKNFEVFINNILILEPSNFIFKLQHKIFSKEVRGHIFWYFLVKYFFRVNILFLFITNFN